MRQGERGYTRGFTLIELMIVVAIIGILASLAVYMFSGQQKKVSAKSEVSAMFAELKIRQEQYQLEFGSYLSTSATNAEDDMWPSAPSGDGSKTALLDSSDPSYPAEWTTLRIAPDTSAVHCSYVVITGDGDDSANVGTIADTRFGFVAPGTDWYYLLAHCDMDQNSTTDSYYLQTSVDSNLYFVDQGK